MGFEMNIAICDDQINELENIRCIVTEYANGHPELSFEINCFSSSAEMFESINKNGAPDIALLDICMPMFSGTEIAREIQDKSNGNTDIIFLTSSPDFAVEAFALHVSDYLIKPYNRMRLVETLDRAIEKRRKRLLVPITCGREIYTVDLYQVLYAESKNHDVDIYLKSGKIIKTRATLTEVKALFNDSSGFLTVGASYIVNLRCVQSILQNELVMISGQAIPIPRRLRNEVRTRYFDFYREEATKHD